MITSKISVGLLYGGRSAEHEVSIQSAKNVYDAIDKDKYDATLILLDKENNWLDKELKNILSKDVIFPVLHGPNGEDGTIQGLLQLAGKAYVGSGVLASAVGMDKDVMKRLWRDAGLPIGDYLVVKKHETAPSYSLIQELVGLPCFIKPANMGSSVGVHKVSTKQDYQQALQDAFLYDNKILIEEYIPGRELECAILGNEEPRASVAGEIVVKNDFYSYQAKYIDEDGAGLVIPAVIESEVQKELQTLAIKAFTTLGCMGLARVDFFLKNNGELILNEINTIPGFTAISMYPKLWQASGINYTELIDKLIKLAILRKEE